MLAGQPPQPIFPNDPNQSGSNIGSNENLDSSQNLLADNFEPALVNPNDFPVPPAQPIDTSVNGFNFFKEIQNRNATHHKNVTGIYSKLDELKKARSNFKTLKESIETTNNLLANDKNNPQLQAFSKVFFQDASQYTAEYEKKFNEIVDPTKFLKTLGSSAKMSQDDKPKRNERGDIIVTAPIGDDGHDKFNKALQTGLIYKSNHGGYALNEAKFIEHQIVKKQTRDFWLPSIEEIAVVAYFDTPIVINLIWAIQTGDKFTIAITASILGMEAVYWIYKNWGALTDRVSSGADAEKVLKELQKNIEKTQTTLVSKPLLDKFAERSPDGQFITHKDGSKQYNSKKLSEVIAASAKHSSNFINYMNTSKPMSNLAAKDRIKIDTAFALHNLVKCGMVTRKDLENKDRMTHAHDLITKSLELSPSMAQAEKPLTQDELSKLSMSMLNDFKNNGKIQGADITLKQDGLSQKVKISDGLFNDISDIFVASNGWQYLQSNFPDGISKMNFQHELESQAELADKTWEQRKDILQNKISQNAEQIQKTQDPKIKEQLEMDGIKLKDQLEKVDFIIKEHPGFVSLSNLEIMQRAKIQKQDKKLEEQKEEKVNNQQNHLQQDEANILEQINSKTQQINKTQDPEEKKKLEEELEKLKSRLDKIRDLISKESKNRESELAKLQQEERSLQDQINTNQLTLEMDQEKKIDDQDQELKTILEVDEEKEVDEELEKDNAPLLQHNGDQDNVLEHEDDDIGLDKLFDESNIDDKELDENPNIKDDHLGHDDNKDNTELLEGDKEQVPNINPTKVDQTIINPQVVIDGKEQGDNQEIDEIIPEEIEIDNENEVTNENNIKSQNDQSMKSSSSDFTLNPHITAARTEVGGNNNELTESQMTIKQLIKESKSNSQSLHESNINENDISINTEYLTDFDINNNQELSQSELEEFEENKNQQPQHNQLPQNPNSVQQNNFMLESWQSNNSSQTLPNHQRNNSQQSQQSSNASTPRSYYTNPNTHQKAKIDTGLTQQQKQNALDNRQKMQNTQSSYGATVPKTISQIKLTPKNKTGIQK